jgi:hypothetical protein
MIIWWICIKIKSDGLIKPLAGQFELIMGLIKVLINFNN